MSDGAGMSAGVQRIAAERRRQIEQEGWTPEHDAGHEGDALALAAACYALPPSQRKMRPYGSTATPGMPSDRGDVTLYCPELWPWHGCYWKSSYRDRVRELEKAGALIAAEIDRTLLAQQQQQQQQTGLGPSSR